MTTTDPARKPPLSTHACVICAARWTQWEDGTWTLRSDECGPCCDNAPMGEQMARLYGEGEGYHLQDATEKKKAIKRRERQQLNDKYRGEICARCDLPFEKHNSDWSCRIRLMPTFKFRDDKQGCAKPVATSQPNERDDNETLAQLFDAMHHPVAAKAVRLAGAVGTVHHAALDWLATYRAEIEAARDKQIGQHLRQAALGKWSAATPILWEIINAIESGEIARGE